MEKRMINTAVDGTVPTLTASYSRHSAADFMYIGEDKNFGKQCPVVECETANSYRIRKLTPRECFRLMGVDDRDIDTIQATGISKTQQYKMAGNSIVVDVLYHIFRQAFTADRDHKQQLF